MPNALKSAQWDSNPDLKHKLISYLGFPIRLPDGEAFGTICLLDCKENHYSADIVALLEKMRSLIEGQLKLQDLLVQNVRQLVSIHEQNRQMENLNQALKQSGEKYRFITENTLDFIWAYNINQNRFIYASPGSERLCGYSSKEIAARGVQGAVTPEFLDAVKQRMKEALRKLRENPASEHVSQNEIQQPCADGSAVWVEYTVKYRLNEDGEVEAVGISRNIEERKRKEQEIYYLSTHDCLTAAYNRAYFYERAKEEIFRADRYQQPLAMLFLDIDHFKSVNDQFGHAAGDEVLSSIAATIAAALRTSDVFARYGGEEFVVLLPGAALAAACSAAEKNTPGGGKCGIAFEDKNNGQPWRDGAQTGRAAGCVVPQNGCGAVPGERKRSQLLRRRWRMKRAEKHQKKPQGFFLVLRTSYRRNADGMF